MNNAFNSCDRARLLGELYALPDLQSVYRITDFAYSQPSTLVLSGCDGQCIQSEQGVRQGDPLSALLFCVYMRQLLEQVSAKTGVRVYGFFDDVGLLGTPQQLTKALTHMQHTLPQASLQLNTAKSHFVYFHDQLTPLSATVRDMLSVHNIECHHRWAGVVGAVVGRDEAAVREGMHSVMSDASGQDAFFRRLQLDDMLLQTAMLLLRIYHCIPTVGISSVSYARLDNSRATDSSCDLRTAPAIYDNVDCSAPDTGIAARRCGWHAV